MMRVLTTSQSDEWLSVLRHCSAMHDVYHLPGYHAVAERRGEGEARLFAYKQAGYTIALPLIIRTLADLPGIGASANTWCDATSVYGYSGPVCSHKEMPRAVIDGFQRGLTAALQELQVVSVFSRLHPLLPEQTMLLQGIGDHQLGGATVSINLSATPVEQRAQYDGTTRNRLNRLARSSATCALDPEQRHLPDFVALYHETMRRVKAEESYLFDPTYFSDLAKNLGPVLKLFVVKMPDGEVISGGLFTLCEGIVQYHLGGTRDTALKLSPMVLLLETVRRWANENGAHTFHLGGGVGAKTDSLFHFKARFSRQRHKFFMWHWIVAPEAYRELSLQKDRWNSERGLRAISASFFPAYRCPAEPVGEQQFFAKKTAAPCAATPRPDSGGLRVLTTNQREEWTGAVQRARQYDFYFLPEYHAFAERCGKGEARLFVYEQAGYTISLPLIIRTLAGLPGIGGWANRWRDGMSVYGYSGPIYSHEDMPPTVIGEFQRALRAALQELQVVSVFSRLHPLLPAQSTLLDGLGNHQPEGVTVSINLSATPVEQRAQYDGATKTRLNRLVRLGVTGALDPEQRHLPEFIALYHETMRRVKAEESYFFDPTYFFDLAKSLGPVLKLFVVKMPDGEVISGGLFTLCDGIVQHHLGGTRDTAVKLSPMVLVLETVRRWANENGAHTFHLGGGVGAKPDSLFQFKAHFSRQRHKFATWRWIVAPQVYSQLSLQKDRWNSERGLRAISASFFPAYRCPAEPDTVPAALSAPAPGMAAPDEIQVAQNG